MAASSLRARGRQEVCEGGEGGGEDWVGVSAAGAQRAQVQQEAAAAPATGCGESGLGDQAPPPPSTSLARRPQGSQVILATAGAQDRLLVGQGEAGAGEGLGGGQEGAACPGEWNGAPSSWNMIPGRPESPRSQEGKVPGPLNRHAGPLMSRGAAGGRSAWAAWK